MASELRRFAPTASAVGSVLAITFAYQSWLLAADAVAASGVELTVGGAALLPVAVLALLALRGLTGGPWPRRLLAGLAFILGVGMLLLGVSPPSPADLSVGERLAVAHPGLSLSWTGTAWAGAYAAVGGVIAVLALLLPPARPARARRFERATPPADADPWSQLDLGIDPTERLGDRPPGWSTMDSGNPTTTEEP